MSSAFLDSLGLGYLDIGYILAGIAGMSLLLFLLTLILLIVQMKKLSRLNRRLQKFMGGKDAKSLEEEISDIFEDNSKLKMAAERNRRDIRRLFHNMEFTYQKCGIIKYDAFKQMGGKLSFSLALLNRKNNGFVLNSVHSSDGCYTYTKEIKEGKSDISLGEEEEQALMMAIGRENKETREERDSKENKEYSNNERKETIEMSNNGTGKQIKINRENKRKKAGKDIKIVKAEHKSI